jgi:hypothetical protein
MAFDYADVMPSIRSTTTVNHNSYQVVHPLWIICIIRLKYQDEINQQNIIIIIIITWRRNPIKQLAPGRADAMTFWATRGEK